MAHSWSAQGATASSVTSIATAGATSAVGDAVRAALMYFSSTGPLAVSITDSKGNSWPSATYNFSYATSGFYLAWFLLQNLPLAGSSHVITGHIGTANSCAIIADGYSGRAASGAIYAINSYADTNFVKPHGGATIPASGSTFAGCDIDGVIVSSNGSDTFTKGSGFTAISQATTTGAAGAAEYLAAAAASSYAGAFTGTQFAQSVGVTVALLPAQSPVQLFRRRNVLLRM